MPKTIASSSLFVADPTKGSRFHASVASCGDATGALAHVEACRARWPDASHHCWAYRLAGGEGRSADDGEPGGSAGRPILAQIDGHDVVDGVVVVARWFGGTKLGVGGLIRAYGGCAGQALDRAELIAFVPMTELTVTFAHAHTGDIHHVLHVYGVEVVDTAWDDHVTMRLRMPTATAAAVGDALRDRTAGAARISESPGA
ncbi:MAG: YigZ family protein [Myxococcota bacterium]